MDTKVSEEAVVRRTSKISWRDIARIGKATGKQDTRRAFVHRSHPCVDRDTAEILRLPEWLGISREKAR